MGRVKCQRCGHSLAKHCKGGEQHTSHKEDARMLAVKDRTGTFICRARHCLEPLCSCVDFVEAA